MKRKLQFTVSTLVIFCGFVAYLVLPHTVNAQSVDLVWQSNTYLPPFYKGKAWMTRESDVKIVAITHGIDVPDNQLRFRWRFNGPVASNQSGVGRNTFTLEQSLRQNSVGVEVLEPDGRLVASNSITIPLKTPQLIVYQNHPLWGIMFNDAIPNNTAVVENSASLLAVPYFFSTESINGILDYHWSINGNDVDNQRADITIESEDEEEVVVEVSAQHPNRLFQESRKVFRLFLNSVTDSS